MELKSSYATLIGLVSNFIILMMILTGQQEGHQQRTLLQLDRSMLGCWVNGDQSSASDKTNDCLARKSSLLGAAATIDSSSCTEHPYSADLQISLDNRSVLVEGSKANAILYDVASGSGLGNFVPAQTNEVLHSIAYSPNGKYVALMYGSIFTDIFDVESGKRLHTLSHPSDQNFPGYPTAMVFFSADSKSIIDADNTGLYIWDIETGKLVQNIPISVDDFATISPDSMRLAIRNRNQTEAVQITIWDIQTNRELQVFSGAWYATYTPNGKYLITYGADGLQVLNANDFRLLRTLGESGEADVSKEISSDSKYMLTADYNGVIRIWEIETGKLVNTFGPEKSPLGGGEFLPNSVNLLTIEPYYPQSTLRGNMLRIRDFQTGKDVSQISIKDKGFLKAVVSPNGKFVVSEDTGNLIQIWDLATRKLLHSLC